MGLHEQARKNQAAEHSRRILKTVSNYAAGKSNLTEYPLGHSGA